MPEYSRTKPQSTDERIYRTLLHLYPRDLREEFGDAMVEFFRDRVARAGRQRGRRFLFLWPSVLIDIARNALPARVDSIGRSLQRVRKRATAARHSPAIRDQRRKDWMFTTILQDVRYAARGIAAKPSFTAIVLATLMLGIGANAAIFSVVNGILLRPLPYADPRSLLWIEHKSPYGSVSEPEFADYRREARSLERVAASSFSTASLTGGTGEPERIAGARVSDGFFQVMGVRPELGRAFTPDEETSHGPLVIILSHGIWQRRYGADPAIVGKQVMVNGTARTVVGVMPARFTYPTAATDAWTPLRLNYDSLWTRNNHYLTLVARLAPGVTYEGAVAELNTIGRRWTREFPDTYAPNQPLQVNASLLGDAILGKTRPYLFALLGAAGFVLLIACVNVANLLLARGESRRKEWAVRTALGASRTRLVRQALTESMLYGVLGGALGTIAAWVGVRVLVAAAPSTIPRLADVHVDLPVLLFSLALSLGTGILFGLAPALRASPDDSAETLKEGGRSGGHGRAATRLRRALVVSEVALATITLSAAGLMIRSLANLQAIDLGFRPSHVLAMRISLPGRKYTADAPVTFYETLLDRVRGLRGVTSAGAVGDLPVRDGWSIWSILIDGAPMTSVAAAPSAMPEQITPGYLEAMGIRLLRGRLFTAQDRAGAPLVAVVSETMEKKLWPGKSALGGTLKMLSAKSPWATVVGVVGDVREGGFLSESPPTMYFPHAQAGASAYYTPADMNLVIKTDGDPLALVGSLRTLIRSLEPDAPVSRIQTMDAVVAESVSSRRFSTQLLLGFATLALVLAGIGIYGVISYGVTQRTFEIGLRLALGAQRGRVLRLIMGEGIRLAVLGLVLGVAGAFAVTRLMRALFVNVAPGDPRTLAGVGLAIALVAALASWLPSRRATAVDPLGAMRTE